MSLLGGHLGGYLGGHLGSRVSALLDGQLDAGEADRAWTHVAGCRSCREAIERETWIKRRIAGLNFDPGSCASSALKGELLGAPRMTFAAEERRQRRALGLAAVGGGAIGAALMGFLAFGVAPADAPTSPTPSSATTHVPRAVVEAGLTR